MVTMKIFYWGTRLNVLCISLDTEMKVLRLEQLDRHLDLADGGRSINRRQLPAGVLAFSGGPRVSDVISGFSTSYK